jgi:hypothetical protein
MPVWQFTPLEYLVMWRIFGRDTLTYPVQYQPEFETEDAFLQASLHAVAAIRDRWSQDLYDTFAVLAGPDARIEMSGFHGGDPDRRIRLHTAVRPHLAVIVVQEPGHRRDSGGMVHVHQIDPATVGKRVAHVLPAARPGGLPAMRLDVDEIGEPDEPAASEPWRTPDHRPPQTRSKVSRLIRLPHGSAGHIAVSPGPAIDNRANPDCREMHWFDVAEDGRYLLARGDDGGLTTTPVGPVELAAHLERAVADAVAALHERV